MARCSFAVWYPISGPSGPNRGGPFKIVHHTTEGYTAKDALDTFRLNRSDPHFTVDATTIYQHIDTNESARALRNDIGGVQTNRDSAIQIEMVGFAALPKNRQTLIRVARLCRWIEQTHGVPAVWPAGLPKPSKDGHDPGHHNRNEATWDSQSGHYGHCHVPENSHWDPGYTETEVKFLMEAKFDLKGELVDDQQSAIQENAMTLRTATVVDSFLADRPPSVMSDHGVVPVGLQAYVRDLALYPPSAAPLKALPPAVLPQVVSKLVPMVATTDVIPAPSGASAKVNVGAVLSFVEGLAAEDINDVLYSVQLAQRAASGKFDRFTQTQFWYQKYIEVLQALGWANEQFGFSLFKHDGGEFRMDQVALKLIGAIATQNQLAVLRQAIETLGDLAEGDEPITLFDFQSSVQSSGNFQLGAVQRADNGTLSMVMGGFYFHAVDDRRRFLFFTWGAKKVQFWAAAQQMTLNKDFYAKRRADVIAKLEIDAERYIADLNF